MMKGLAFLEGKQILIGIPAKNAGRDGATITNVELAFIHSFGSPVRHIPPRPFLEPGINDSKDAICEELKAAVISALSGDTGGAYAHLDGAGQEGENGVKARFPPLIDTGSLRASITHEVK